jgi:hypothetical protein
LDDGALNGVLQFTHISGPGIGEHDFACAVGEALGLAAVPAGETLQEMIGKFDDILRALAQGGHVRRRNVELVIEILAKLAFLDGMQQIAV